MIDEEYSTAGAARRLGYILPEDWPDDLEIRFSRKLTKDGVLEQMITAYPKGYVAACSCVATIKADL